MAPPKARDIINVEGEQRDGTRFARLRDANGVETVEDVRTLKRTDLVRVVVRLAAMKGHTIVGRPMERSNEQLIAYASTIFTLVPGDVIATGTPAGVGFSRKPPRFMKPGDIVEVEIEKIGLLRNPITQQA